MFSLSAGGTATRQCHICGARADHGRVFTPFRELLSLPSFPPGRPLQGCVFLKLLPWFEVEGRTVTGIPHVARARHHRCMCAGHFVQPVLSEFDIFMQGPMSQSRMVALTQCVPRRALHVAVQGLLSILSPKLLALLPAWNAVTTANPSRQTGLQCIQSVWGLLQKV